jgi:hypothetical protein
MDLCVRIGGRNGEMGIVQLSTSDKAEAEEAHGRPN